MVITLSDPSLVLLIGPSGSGKSTFARRHFRATEVLSSDFCRALVCDNENNQAATEDAFDLLHLILAKRLQRRRTTLIDATNVQTMARESLTAVAKERNIPIVAVVFMLPGELCQARNRLRSYRRVPADIIQKQISQLADSVGCLPDEGFNAIFTLQTVEEADSVSVLRDERQS